MFNKFGPYLIEEKITSMKDMILSKRVYRFDNDYGALIVEYSDMAGEYELTPLKFRQSNEEYLEISVSGIDPDHILYSPERIEQHLFRIMRVTKP